MLRMSPDPTVAVLLSIALYGWIALTLVVLTVGVVSVVRAVYVPVRIKLLWVALQMVVPVVGTAVWFAAGYQSPRIRRALGYK